METSVLSRARTEVGCDFLLLCPVVEEGVGGGTTVHERVTSCKGVMFLDNMKEAGAVQMEEVDRSLGVRTMEVVIR